MKEITPFPDQFDLINGVRNSMRRHKSVLMQSATGTGKTVMASYMMQQTPSRAAQSHHRPSHRLHVQPECQHHETIAR